MSCSPDFKAFTDRRAGNMPLRWLLTVGLYCWLIRWMPVDTCQAQHPLIERYRHEAITRWEGELKKLEQLDQQQPDPENAILFVGSSSIRLWKDIARDMAPWPAVGRGYGGARLSDLVVFTERLLAAHDYRALVVFVANDITGGKDANNSDKSPEEVLELFKLFVQIARQHRPDRPIFFISITPTSSRFSVWPQVNCANELIRGYTLTQQHLHFIDTRCHFFTPDCLPNDELFVADKLHLSPSGYQLWAQIIKAALLEKLGFP
ncbi:MAG: hypothetical protein KF752_14785 [Pirellulaceae bacterium]|nr:hypothetical protein [Pirellulaceae bacterium]